MIRHCGVVGLLCESNGYIKFKINSGINSEIKIKSFRALRAASHFLLLVQEKVTKEKDTPVSRRAEKAPRGPLRCSP